MKKNCFQALLLALVLSVNTVAFATGNSTKPSDTNSTVTEEKAEKKNEFPVPNADSAIVLDVKSGDVIYALDADKKVYPAGLTNLMTAVLALETKGVNDTFKVTKDVLSGVTYDQPQLGLQENETYTIEQLVHAVILNSNNDASNALAIATAGSVDEFVKKMNEKAKDLGLNDTNFTNPSGFHNENHYTTASDMAYLAQYALQNETIASIAKTQKYTFPPTGIRTSEKTILSTNHLVSRYKYPYHYYANATGLKSGNSTEAGYCLAATAVKNGFTVLSVIMGAPNQDANEKAYSFRDTAAIFDYVFDTYQSVLLAKKGDVIHDTKVDEAKNSTRLALTVENDVYATLKKSADKDIIKNEIEVTEEAKAPIEMGQVFGTVTYSYNERELTTVNLVAANEVKRDFILHIINSVLGFIFHPIVIIILLAILYIWAKLRIARNRKRRLRHSKMVSQQRGNARTGTTTRPTSSSYSRRDY